MISTTLPLRIDMLAYPCMSAISAKLPDPAPKRTPPFCKAIFR